VLDPVSANQESAQGSGPAAPARPLAPEAPIPPIQASSPFPPLNFSLPNAETPVAFSPLSEGPAFAHVSPVPDVNAFPSLSENEFDFASFMNQQDAATFTGHNFFSYIDPSLSFLDANPSPLEQTAGVTKTIDATILATQLNSFEAPSHFMPPPSHATPPPFAFDEALPGPEPLLQPLDLGPAPDLPAGDMRWEDPGQWKAYREELYPWLVTSRLHYPPVWSHFLDAALSAQIEPLRWVSTAVCLSHLPTTDSLTFKNCELVDSRRLPTSQRPVEVTQWMSRKGRPAKDIEVQSDFGTRVEGWFLECMTIKSPYGPYDPNFDMASADLSESGPYAPLFDDITSTGICLFVFAMALWGRRIQDYGPRFLLEPNEHERWVSLATKLAILLRAMHDWRLNVQAQFDMQDASKPISKAKASIKRGRASTISKPPGVSSNVEGDNGSEMSNSAVLRRSRRLQGG
jgi:hypothetical protein